MTITASAPTHTPHPAKPAAPSPAAGFAGPWHGTPIFAGPAAPAGAAPAAKPWHGKTSVLPFVIGAGLALALADTRAAPVVIAVLTGAVIFQLLNL